MAGKEDREYARKHIDKKLRNRLRIYFLISLILIGIVIYEIFIHSVTLPLAAAGIIIGILLGFISSRMFRISWDHNARQIVSRLDIFGGIILILYIIFALFRKQLISDVIPAPEVSGVSMALVTGIMIGRVLGTRGRIIQLLKEQNVF